MPGFHYVAKDETGKERRGVLEAQDPADLQLKLQGDRLYLVSARPVRQKTFRPLKPAVLADFNRQLGSLVGAGVSLIRALAIIAEEEGLKADYKTLYTNVTREVRQGTALSEAMEHQGRAFPSLMIYMIRAAEASGRMEATAMQLAVHYDKDGRLKAKVKSSMTYPKILAVLLVGAVAVLMGFVMPQFDDLFAMMDELPLPTRILFGISDLVTQHWPLLLIGIVCLVVALKLLFRVDKVRLFKDKFILHIPKVGRLLKIIYTARFARTLSSLYACGISIVSALQISRNVIGNRYIESQFDALIQDVRAGTPLSVAIAKVDGFVQKLSSSVRVGEEAGNLEDMLLHTADTFDYESEQALNRLVAIAEPAMIVLMAVVIAFFMYAVIMPIYDSYSALG